MAVSISVDEPEIDITVRNYEGYSEATGIRAPVVMGSAVSQKGDGSVADGLSAAVVMGDVTSTKGDASVAGGISAQAVQGDAQSQKGDQSVAGGVSSQVVAGDVESDKGDTSLADGQSLPVVMGAVQMEGPIDLVQEYLFALTGRDASGAHYDINGDSDVFVNSDGTNTATVGDPVGYVEDISGNGAHATQSTTANKPVLRQDTNGKKYLEFQFGESLNTGVTGDTVVLGYALPSIGGADIDYAPSSGLALEVTGAEYAVVGGDIPTVEKDALGDYMQAVAMAYKSAEITSLQNHFRDQPLERAGVERWDVSQITNIKRFLRRTKITDLSPLSGWDISQVVNMNGVFTFCSDLSDLSPISGWDTSNVKDMAALFRGTSVTDPSGISGWDTSNVELMFNFFQGASVKDLSPISGWDTSQVTNTASMFKNTRVSDLSPISGWDTSQVTNMPFMFQNTSVSDFSPISGWDVSALSNAAVFADGSPTDSVSAGDMLAGWTDGSPNTASDLQSGVRIDINNADYTQMNTAGQDAVDSLCSDPPNWTVNVTNAPADC